MINWAACPLEAI
jgi:hypothetical protein